MRRVFRNRSNVRHSAGSHANATFSNPRFSEEILRAASRLSLKLSIFARSGVAQCCLLQRGASKCAAGKGRPARCNAALIFVTVILVAAFMLAAHHVPSWWEFAVIFTALARALVYGGIVWLLYIALEPYVRRQWRQTLIGWNRVLAGAWRDPLTAGDVLIGVTWGAVSGMLACISALLRMRTGEE